MRKEFRLEYSPGDDAWRDRPWPNGQVYLCGVEVREVFATDSGAPAVLIVDDKPFEGAIRFEPDVVADRGEDEEPEDCTFVKVGDEYYEMSYRSARTLWHYWPEPDDLYARWDQ